jgi:chromosome segregation ATPase
MNTELSEKFKGISETLADIKQECVRLEAEINTKNNAITSLKDDIDVLEAITPNDEEKLLPVKNTQDELKRNVCARLYKNLTLEQLKNLEKTAKENFAAQKRNYALEIP